MDLLVKEMLLTSLLSCLTNICSRERNRICMYVSVRRRERVCMCVFEREKRKNVREKECACMFMLGKVWGRDRKIKRNVRGSEMILYINVYNINVYYIYIVSYCIVFYREWDKIFCFIIYFIQIYVFSTRFYTILS